MGVIIIGPDGEIEQNTYDKPKEEDQQSDLRDQFNYIAPGLQHVVPDEKPRTPPPAPVNIEDITPKRDTPKGPTLH